MIDLSAISHDDLLAQFQQSYKEIFRVKIGGNNVGVTPWDLFYELLRRSAASTNPLCNTGFMDGSVIVQGTGGCLQENNRQFLWRDTENQFCINAFNNTSVIEALVVGNTPILPFASRVASASPSYELGELGFAQFIARAKNRQLGEVQLVMSSFPDEYNNSVWGGSYLANSTMLKNVTEPSNQAKKFLFDIESGGRKAYEFHMTNNIGSHLSEYTKVFSLEESGRARIDRYGTGLLSGTPTYDLGIDAQGNILEIPQGSITSDQEIKENIQDLEGNIINLLSPKVYDKKIATSKSLAVQNQAEIDAYIAAGEQIDELGNSKAPPPIYTENIVFENIKEFGFLAQELQQVIPEAVTQTGDILSYQPHQLIPHLVANAKSQNAKIALLESEIAEIKAALNL